MISKKHLILLCTLFCSVARSQVVSEDFNHGSQSISEGNCWEYDNVSIATASSMNSGGDAPLAHADINGLLTSAELASPFIQFNGKGTITFKHKMAADAWYFGSSVLQLYLRDVSGNLTGPYFSHTYRQISFTNPSPNGNPTTTRSASVSISFNGFYQVVWRWAGVSSYANALLDDVIIPSDTSSLHQYDTACAQNLNVLYEPSTATTAANFSYSWSWVDPSGGSLNRINSNNRTAEVDWTAGAGNYILLAREFYNSSCTGRKTFIHVNVIQPATLAASTDTVCPDESPMVLFYFTGDPPWELNYRLDSGPLQTLTTANAFYTLSLPIGTSHFEMISLADGGTCAGIIAVGSPPIIYYPNPGSGPVFHF